MEDWALGSARRVVGEDHAGSAMSAGAFVGRHHGICSYEQLSIVQPISSIGQFESKSLGLNSWNSQFRQDLEQTGPNTAGEDRPLSGITSALYGIALMKPLRDRSMRQRITLVIELTSCVVLLLACTAMFVFQAWSIRENFVSQLTVTGEIAANNVAEAAMSRDERRANQTLAGLHAMPQLVSATLHLSDGKRLAQWGADEAEGFKQVSLSDRFTVNGTRVQLVQPVLHDGQRVGTLALQADFRSLSIDLLRLYGGILVLVLGASLLLALFLSGRFQRFVSAPILRLADVAQRIAHDKDYTMRAEKTGDDEVGALTDAFNQMLGQIQSQNAALRESEERFRSVAESAADAIIITDGNQSIVSWNKGARLMFSYEADEIQGRPLSDLIAESYRPAFTAGMASLRPNAAGEKTSPAMELFGVRKDGVEFPLEMAMSAWTTCSGVFFSGVIRDVSERRTAEVTLRDSQQRLLETSRLAGMAEVATGVLHNVGNVLNSVNVSAGLVVEKLRRSKVPNLGKAAALLTDKNDTLGDFLTNDPNGQKIPGYLAKLSQVSGGGKRRNPDRGRSARAPHRAH